MKIAIVGSGISGLISAYTLQSDHDVTLYEAGETLGGHTSTVDVELDGRTYAIDTGFIVFNDRTYPNFKKFLRQIGVSWQDTEMGFSVSDPDFEIEYSGNLLNMILTQKLNLLRPSFHRFISEILRFNKQCKQIEADGDIPMGMTLGEFMKTHGYSERMKNYYLYPMVGAIWSSSYNEAADFSLDFFIKFFSNHGLFNLHDRPQWHVIQGGSREYIRALEKFRKFKICLGRPVHSITRSENKVSVASHGAIENYDRVVLACHSDQALKLLKDPSADEQAILSRLPYQKNEVTLHTDIRLLPRQRRNWASWNYMVQRDDRRNSMQTTVSYNMNILQSIQSPHTFVVSLNQNEKIDANKVLRKFEYDHPVFSSEAERAKLERGKINGVNRTHFCGAYWYNGFHEDGVRSALDVAAQFGASL